MNCMLLSLDACVCLSTFLLFDRVLSLYPPIYLIYLCNYLLIYARTHTCTHIFVLCGTFVVCVCVDT